MTLYPLISNLVKEKDNRRESRQMCVSAPPKLAWQRTTPVATPISTFRGGGGGMGRLARHNLYIHTVVTVQLSF